MQHDTIITVTGGPGVARKIITLNQLKEWVGKTMTMAGCSDPGVGDRVVHAVRQAVDPSTGAIEESAVMNIIMAEIADALGPAP